MELSEAVELLKLIAPSQVFQRPYAEAFRIVLAEAERVTTLVACEKCGRGVRWRYAVKGLCPDCAAAEIDRLTAERDAYRAKAEECYSPAYGEVGDERLSDWVRYFAGLRDDKPGEGGGR